MTRPPSAANCLNALTSEVGYGTVGIHRKSTLTSGGRSSSDPSKTSTRVRTWPSTVLRNVDGFWHPPCDPAVTDERQSTHTSAPAPRGLSVEKPTRFWTRTTLSGSAMPVLSKTLTSLKTTMSVPGGGGGGSPLDAASTGAT